MDETTVESDLTPDRPEPQQPIVAKAGGHYRVRRYILVAAMIGFGIWFGRDGWVTYPKANEEIKRVNAEMKAAQTSHDQVAIARLDARQRALKDSHSELDILNQKRLAFILPILGLAYLAWIFRKSRGTIELANDLLTAPGHPPVPIGSIESVDASRWDRKGIALLSYKVDDKPGTIELDDFVYDQKPIDDMYEVIARRRGEWKPLAKAEAQEIAPE